MKRQKKSPAMEHAEPPAFPAGKSGADDGEEAGEGRRVLEFLPSSWRRDWLLAFLLVAVTLMAYQPVWHAGFVWDDDLMLLKNPLMHQAGGWYRAWFNRAANDFVPAVVTSFWLEWRVWGANPLGYHLDNVLLHTLDALLLWRILLRLKIPGAWLAAAIFALHPVNVESVAWITQRKNTLCLFFYAAALLSYLTFEDSGRWRWFWLAAGMFLLALMSKTAVVPMPVVLLGLAWWRRGRIEPKDIRRSLVFVALAAAGSLLAIWIQHGAAMGEMVRTDSFWARLAGAGWAAWFYLYKAFLPLNLALVYPRWQIDPRNVLSYIPLALLAAAFVLCWRVQRRWGRGLFLWLAYFVLMLLPVLGFVNIYFMLYSLVADHWQYFAIIGPIVVAAAIVIRRPLLAATLLLALGALTWRQCGMFANGETLWQTTLRRNPDCWLAKGNLGAIFLREGKVDEAMNDFQQALKTNPDDAEAHSNLAIALRQKGRTDEAIAHYQAALKIKPNYADAHYNLGNALLQKGRMNDAITQYQDTLQLQPDYAEAHFNLGIALDQTGRTDEAIEHFQKTLALNPNFAEAHFRLGNAFSQKGQLAEAITEFQKALQFTPGDPAIQNNLAWLLATCPQASLRNGTKAVELARQASELTGGKSPAFLDTLAAAYAEAGQFSEAVKTAQDALRLAEAQTNTVLTGELKSELKLYQAGGPYRSPEQTH
jgi:protein O-mannosyl-transferase